MERQNTVFPSHKAEFRPHDRVSLYPLQAVTMIGMAVSIRSFLFVLFLLLRRLVVGPEAEGRVHAAQHKFLSYGDHHVLRGDHRGIYPAVSLEVETAEIRYQKGMGHQ